MQQEQLLRVLEMLCNSTSNFYSPGSQGYAQVFTKMNLHPAELGAALMCNMDVRPTELHHASVKALSCDLARPVANNVSAGADHQPDHD